MAVEKAPVVEKAPAVNTAKLNTSIGQLAEYVQDLAKRTDSNPGGVLLAESYINELNNADKQQARWRRIYYNLRGYVLVASALITGLTAFNLHGSLAFGFRVATVTLSALVTVVAGLLELLQVNNRWRLYRQLRTTLESLGWQTAVQRNAAPGALLAKLGSGFIKAMNTFELHYTSQVAASADGGSGESSTDQSGESRAKKGKKTSTSGSPK
jgi:hypothetical protein